MPAVPVPYQRDLAHVHQQAFGAHPARLAPSILKLLQPVAERGGVVLEIGCGTGMLTRHLVNAGLRVIASDASPDMLDIAREQVPGVQEFRVIALPDDPLPEVDAVVGIGHPLSYFTAEAPVHASLAAIAAALRPGGMLVLDLHGLRWADTTRDDPVLGRLGEDWALVSWSELPEPHRYVKFLTTFVRTDDGTYRRSDERHDMVLVDPERAAEVLRRNGITVELGDSFGDVILPAGLVSIVGTRP